MRSPKGCSRRGSPSSREDEFGAWARSFNEMAEALEAKISALSAAQARERRFTADVAHELRTPLTALVGGGRRCSPSTSTRCPPTRGARPSCSSSTSSGMRRLVEDLMEISRFDAGAEAIRPAPVELVALVEGAVAARGWNGRVELEGDERHAHHRPRRVERIVVNLIGNALEHGGGRASVRVGRGRRRRDRRGRRRRARHPRRARRARVRALLQGRPGAQRLGQRARPGHRPRERAAARRAHRASRARRAPAAASRCACRL